jgi:beta-lactam-binding protein with PASTA domain
VDGTSDSRRTFGARVAALFVVLLATGTASAAPESTLVPEVIDLPETRAVALLASAGFETFREDVDGDPAGTVATQSPGGFRRAAPKSAVTIRVRRGTAAKAPAVPALPPAPAPHPVDPQGAPPPPQDAATGLEVPNVLGKTENEAVLALSRWRVRVLVVLGTEGNDGRVVDQVPAAGTPLVEGSEIAVTVARRTIDPRAAIVPSVVGLDGQVAERQMTGLGLVPLVTPAPSDPAGAGKVVSQDPAPGTVVAKGSNVALGVGAPASAALMETEAPDVVHLGEGDARARVNGAGLVVATKDRLAPEAAGVVLEQDPPPGTRLVRGRTMTLVVGRALMLPIRVPETLGLAAPAAVEALRAAGFAVEEAGAVSLPGSAGKVIAQDPPGGATAIRTSVVRIVVGRMSPTVGVSVRVPSVVGRSEEQARADLAAVGLRVRSVPTTGTMDTRGRVLGQTPPATTTVPRGAEVVLEVSTPPTSSAPVTLPNYVGTDVSVAQADLAARGLVASITTTPGGPDGRVTGQIPEVGTRVDPGSTVTLVVARVPPLDQVVLIDPPHRAALPQSHEASLRWLAVTGAEDYEVEVLVWKDGAWVRANHTPSTDLRHTLKKMRRGTYQWHVRARRDKGRVVGAWSEWRQITWH